MKFGPLISWWTTHLVESWDPMLGAVDLDGLGEDLSALLTVDAREVAGPHGMWSCGPLDTTGRAYAREAGWDASPRQAG